MNSRDVSADGRRLRAALIGCIQRPCPNEYEPLGWHKQYSGPIALWKLWPG